MKERTSEEIVAILSGERYGSDAEAVAAAQALAEPGDEIQLHQVDCAVDDEMRGCTCKPIIVTGTARKPSA